LFSFHCKAQITDESINSVQIGLLGVWWNNESKLSLNWSLRTEVGYESPYFANQNQYFVFLPAVSLEPRWYYNSKKRISNSNNTFHNSGNFISMSVRYYPKILAYSPTGENDTHGGSFLIFSWGTRRNINYRWNVELVSGIGVDPITKIPTNVNGNEFILHFTLRIGYKYGKKNFKN